MNSRSFVFRVNKLRLHLGFSKFSHNRKSFYCVLNGFNLILSKLVFGVIKEKRQPNLGVASSLLAYFLTKILLRR